ncbi:hypothetical protein ACFQ41_04785 [Lacticaseibacillus suilingensis]|uniref:Uncharacterized protein n=1 Tax=Lacticaseibacillus suilingensis TaxID=2799577 RepID=A0ABW4BDQ5_9LACO|nr:hypothetical protein [Lacticaseibacillus suilingensis]
MSKETKKDVFNAAVEKAVGMTLVAGYTSYGEKYRKDMQKRYAAATDGDPACPWCHEFGDKYGDTTYSDNLGRKVHIKGGMMLAGGQYESAQMAIEDGGIIGIFAEGDDEGWEPIHFCPMCGRSLGASRDA